MQTATQAVVQVVTYGSDTGSDTYDSLAAGDPPEGRLQGLARRQRPGRLQQVVRLQGSVTPHVCW